MFLFSSHRAPFTKKKEQNIIFYDGACGLCHRLIRFVLKNDTENHFYFARIQSSFGSALLRKHGQDPDVLKSLYLIVDFEGPAETLRSQADAWLCILNKLDDPWNVGKILKIFPKSWLNMGYNLISRNRYRVFGKNAECVVPEACDKDRFIEK